MLSLSLPRSRSALLEHAHPLALPHSCSRLSCPLPPLLEFRLQQFFLLLQLGPARSLSSTDGLEAGVEFAMCRSRTLGSSIVDLVAVCTSCTLGSIDDLEFILGRRHAPPLSVQRASITSCITSSSTRRMLLRSLHFSRIFSRGMLLMCV